MAEGHEGWKCPICKKIHAPRVKYCKKCSKEIKESVQLIEG